MNITLSSTTIYSGGKRRTKTLIDKCISCGVNFYHFKWDDQQYCSKQCYFNKDKVLSRCITCNKEVYRSKSGYLRNNGNSYCSRECYNYRRKSNLKRLKRHTQFYDTLIENSSCKCGQSESYLLQIHHKDGNRYNNTINNLEVLCANCHIKRHLKRRIKDGKLVYHPKSLTSEETLKELNI